MARAKQQVQSASRHEMHPVEKLGLRISSMINHPVAQHQRWVTIHRLDTDGDREWDEVMSVLTATDGLEMTFNDEDDSVTLRWEAESDDDRPAEAEDFEVAAEPAPF